MNEVSAKIENLFKRIVQKDQRIHNAYFLVHSEKFGIHLNLAEGFTGNMSANGQQRYLIASISKLFTSVLFALFVEQQKLNYDDPIHLYIEQDLLNNLHVPLPIMDSSRGHSLV
ncbi:beta-lactamase family protein [Paenibacillus sp. N3/727]|uniref:serine hydrolase domain-containing protein n=1 Tax=Paenibacillus sp. N3/727 TaxID=2925845 RepID=UPI001F52E315|nr:serine hydrolase domain-containing protein [Paenibacillus sp. N3/727]UNK20653.1 beta-lactamase family protein [Paenibacillus sp. N3/727]